MINGWRCKMVDTQLDTISDDEIMVAPIRTSFIIAQKKPSFRDLEASYGMPKSKIHEIATRENWEMQRSDYHRNMITKSQKNIMNRVERERRKKLEKLNNIFHKGADRLLELMDSDKYVVSVRDLNILVKIAEFLEGNPEKIEEKRFVLEKPISEYSVEELIAIKNQIIEGKAKVIDTYDDKSDENYVDYEEIEDEDE